MRMELQATPQEVMRAVEAFQEFGRAQHVPSRILSGLALALEECGSNIVTHALGRDAQKKFRLAVERQERRILIELRDAGPELDFEMFNKTPVPAAEDDPPGGWGIQIIRRYTDSIRYRRDANENVLLLIKDLDEPPPVKEVNSEKTKT